MTEYEKERDDAAIEWFGNQPYCDTSCAQGFKAGADWANERANGKLRIAVRSLEAALEYVNNYPIGTTDDPQEKTGGARDVMEREISQTLAEIKEAK